jgi:hypothetical protein
MKYSILLLAAIFFLSIFVQAQTPFSFPLQHEVTWVGGFPGHETDWNVPQNWSDFRVPDEFDRVIIPHKRNFFPEIKAETPAVDAMLVESGAQVTILPDGTLTVTGESGFFDGVTVGGKIINEGVLEIEQSSSSVLRAALEKCRGTGKIITGAAAVNAVASQR